MGFSLQHPKEGFECCSIKGAQPRAGRGRRELCCQDLGTVPAGELAVSHPAECLPNTNLEEHIGHEKQISESPSKAEGWVSYQLPRARGQPAWLQRAAQKQEVLAAPPALLQLHTLPRRPLRASVHFSHFLRFSLSPPKKAFSARKRHLYLSQLQSAAVAPDVLVGSRPHLWVPPLSPPAPSRENRGCCLF